jgi:hypothetical protein
LLPRGLATEEPGEEIDVAALCESYCGTTGSLACGESSADCVQKCEFEGEIVAEACRSSYRANIVCESAAASNFACDAAGVAVLKAGVCAEEQTAIASCTLQESGASELAAEACAGGCVRGELTPPISCGYTPDVLACATSCWTTFLLLSDECSLLLLEQTSCEVAAGADHWTCVDGKPQFDDSGCAAESQAFQECTQG